MCVWCLRAFMCVHVSACLHTCMLECALHACNTSRGSKRTLDPLELS